MAENRSAGPQPLVSVVIIFLNSERFLAEAIDSVRDQTWQTWELLLVDDGSTDRSTTIARRYADAEPGRIRYLEHDGHANLGMSASRNLGVAHAAGEWVALLDSDDVWRTDALESRMDALTNHPDADLVYGPARHWYSWDASSAKADTIQDIGVEPGLVRSGAALAAHFIEKGTGTPCPSSIVMRREVFRRLGGFEAAFRGMYEDQVFCFKAALGARVLVAGYSGLLYRQHEDSCCSVEFRANRQAAARLRFLRWARRHASRSAAADARLRQTVRRHYRAAWWATGAPGRLRRTARGLLPEPVVGWLKARRP